VQEATSLRVSRETRNRLSVIGSKDDTFDKIIQRLIDFYENGGEMLPLASHKRAGKRLTFALPKRQEES